MPFDWSPIRGAYLAGDYAGAREMLAKAPKPRADLWLSRIDNREERNAETIARLLSLQSTDARVMAERDVWLAAAYNSSREFGLAHQLLERAIPVLPPNSEMYFRALYTRALTYYLSGDYAAAEAQTVELRKSPHAVDRAQAHAMRSWLDARREDLRAQLASLLEAVLELESTDERDEYVFVHTLLPLAALAREMPTQGVIERLRPLASTARSVRATAFARFQLIRILGWIDALQGDELSALRRWHEAESAAPSPFWRVFCMVDRAYFSSVMRRTEAAEALQAVHEAASRLPWADTHEDERIILLTIAQIFAQDHAALAQRYLAMFRAIPTPMHDRMGWVGDRRTRALQIYPQGVALAHLGEREAAVEMLQEAWEIFTHFEYGWRAALAAIDLYKATGERIWLERAREQAAPWPKSWVARDVRELR